MRRCLETRNTALLDDLALEYDGLETEARAVLEELRLGQTIGNGERSRFLEELRQLRLGAHTLAALSESEALYLRWGQQRARPARGYTASGEASQEPRTSVHWEA